MHDEAGGVLFSVSHPRAVSKERDRENGGTERAVRRKQGVSF